MSTVTSNLTTTQLQSSSTSYTHTQQMLTLSYLSYLGFELDKNNYQNATTLYPLIERGLETWAPLADQWTLAWGLAVFKFPFTLFDDNVMFVVKHITSPDTYAIVIRGTNPIGLSDWLFEDLLVQAMVDWPYKDPNSSLDPKISYATHLGLKALQNMTAAKGLPGEGEDLKAFLRRCIQNKEGSHLPIAVTGHSLAGALAPLLALWLSDTQGVQAYSPNEEWDPQRLAQLSCVAFAGPSPGNRHFARYYDQQLGQLTERIHNHLDVVPHAWSPATMKGALSLYRGTANPDLLLRVAYYFFRWSTRHTHYEQLKPKSPSFSGKVYKHLHSYSLQMIAQHVLGYLEAFNLTGEVQLGLLDETLWRAHRKEHLLNPLTGPLFSH